MRQVKGLDPSPARRILRNPLLQPWVGQFDRGVVVRVFDMRGRVHPRARPMGGHRTGKLQCSQPESYTDRCAVTPISVTCESRSVAFRASRGDVYAVAHQIAVALFYDVAEMDAD